MRKNKAVAVSKHTLRWNAVAWIAFLAALGGIVTLILAGPTLLAEWRVPGSLQESLGNASTTISSSTPGYITLRDEHEQAVQILDQLPGGSDVTVYAKYDVHGICGNPHALACSSPGGSVIWVSMAAGMQLREVVIHEFMHLRTNFLESIWLRLNYTAFPNAAVGIPFNAGVEGVADCGVQLLDSDWKSDGPLPYIDGDCTPHQLALAQAVLDDTPLWEAHS